MKCSYCGRENTEEAVHCYECGTSFLPEPIVEPRKKEPKPPILFRWKLCLIGLAWIAAGARLFAIDPNQSPEVSLIWFSIATPFGVLAILFQYMTQWGGEYLHPAAGWLYYAILTFAGLRAERRWSFFLAYAILCASLLFSVVATDVLVHFKF